MHGEPFPDLKDGRPGALDDAGVRIGLEHDRDVTVRLVLIVQDDRTGFGHQYASEIRCALLGSTAD